VDKIMDMMGFAPADGKLPVRAFSGGWKMRIGLGKVLLQDPGVLMLDEVSAGSAGPMVGPSPRLINSRSNTTPSRSRRTTWTWTRWSGSSPSSARRRCP